MLEGTYNTWSIVLSAVSLVVAVIGLCAVYYQIRKLQLAGWSSTHSILTSQSFEILKFFSEHPVTYAYFYQRKELTDDEPKKIIILYAAEALANFMEQLVLQKDHMPESQWKVWHRFILMTFEKSLVMKEFLKEHKKWYADELLELADEIGALT